MNERAATGRGRQALEILAGAVVLIVATISLTRAARDNPTHVDELDWTTRTYFYRLAFLDGDLTHPLWSGLDSVDQPHVADFAIGLGLDLHGDPIPEVPGGSLSWFGQPMPEGPRLIAARRPGVVLAATTAVFVSLLARLVSGSIAAGLVAGLGFAVHPLALRCLPMAMSDAPLLFFSTAALVLVVWAFPGLAGRPGAGSPWPRAILLAVGPLALGLATGAKLTGVFASAATLATLGAVTLVRGLAPGWRGRFGTLVAFALATAGWTIAVNPTLHRNPIGRFRAMLHHRVELGRRQAIGQAEYAMPDLPAKVRALAHHVDRLGPENGPFPAGPIALATLTVLGLAGAAVGEAVRAIRWRPLSRATPIVVTMAALLVGLLPSLPLNWDRYFLPFLPPALVIPVCAAAALAGRLAGAIRRAIGAGNPPLDARRTDGAPPAALRGDPLLQ